MTPVDVAVSYAYEDELLMKELVSHLGILKRQGFIRDWHDREITAGTEWKEKIDRHLDSADIILLLVSPDFITSDYCYDIEMTRALERHAAGTARVIPVILRPVDQWHAAPFGMLRAVPTDGKPITSWPNRDEAFADIARYIRYTVEELRTPPIPKANSKTVRNKVFVSYSHADSRFLDRFHIFIKPLERQGLIDTWDDTRIMASQRWKEEIRNALDATKVAVLLISADFLASDFIMNDELPPLLAAAETEGTHIMPVIISPCRFTATPALSRFQAVNPNLQPLISMNRNKREELWLKVTNDIHKILHI